MIYSRRLIATMTLVAGAALAQQYAQPAPAARPAQTAVPQPAPQPPAPVRVAAPPPVPAWPVLAPMQPMPGMPADVFDWQDRAFELQQRSLEAQERALDSGMRLKVSQLSADLAQNFAWMPQPAKLGAIENDYRVYASGQQALENRRWEQALENFNQVAARAGSLADGAWYWKAYTLRKMGRRDEALAAIAELRKTYPNSRWLDDAKALELEVRQATGQNVSPESESDEELKLLALNSLMRSDPDRAFPLLENLLKSSQSPRLKRNAVFVLAQSDTPKAQQLLEQVARGQGNPDVQLTAIRYLGERRRNTNGPQILAEIYNASNDVNVKRLVLNSLSGSRDKDRLLQIARAEKNESLRMDAIGRLASLNTAQTELWQMYQNETNLEIKQRILQTLPQSGGVERLVEVARTEKDPRLRRYAIQSLASPRASGASEALVSIYGAEQDPNLKQAIIDALYSQRNAKAMVQVARSEKDFRMKQRIVERLGSMKDPAATEYLMEILK